MFVVAGHHEHWVIWWRRAATNIGFYPIYWTYVQFCGCTNHKADHKHWANAQYIYFF
uniref:Uncharacterized protein n=1 Tax=Cyanoptyche gloeocystis TaxID=77922 RepID=A0A3G1IW61_9EUKA|nr:hypothetical protein [Cyanoptyche gloeocystis]